MDFAKYYESICRFKPIKRDEEEALFREYYQEATSERRKKFIRDKIINSNLRFVFKMARNYSRNDINQFEELICAGNEGLLVGFDKYDPASGVKFLTYAGWWVRQRILKEMSKFRIVALPIWKQQLAAKINKFVDSRDALPTMEELQEEFPDKSEKDLRELYQTRYLTFFFDDMDIEDGFEDPIIEILEGEIDDQRLNEVVDSLSPEKRILISLIFGLDDGKERSITEVSRTLCVTRKDLRQLKKDAMQELQEKLLSF